MLVLAIAMLVIPFFLALNGKDSPGMYEVAGFGAALAWAWVYYRIFRHRLLYAVYIKQRDAWIEGIPQSIMEQVTALPYPATD
jgi:hypothetical protein